MWTINNPSNLKALVSFPGERVREVDQRDPEWGQVRKGKGAKKDQKMPTFWQEVWKIILYTITTISGE